MTNLLDLLPASAALAWPLIIAFAWIAGEVVHRYTGLPRISVYGVAGFAFGNSRLGLVSTAGDAGTLLANVAFGLILFEFGYRINLLWLRRNPWLGATGVLESSATFVAVYLLARWWDVSTLTALLLASLAMSTSPASVLRVINEQRSSGQVTERVLHLAAVNCVLAVFAFKVTVGLWAFESSGDVWKAASSSVLVLAVSAGLGAAFGLGVPALLRGTGRMGKDTTVAFAIAVILLVGICHAFKFSPVLAALSFGLVARHRRVVLNQAQRNFGALGDLLVVVLFTYVAFTIDWPRVVAGYALGLSLVGARLAVKVLAVAALAHASGTTWRKGALTGLALSPISVFVILLLEQTRNLGVDLVDELAPLAAATLLLELAGPVVTQYALRLARETHPDRER